MQKHKEELTVGVLDIYGFEIFMVRGCVCCIAVLVLFSDGDYVMYSFIGGVVWV